MKSVSSRSMMRCLRTTRSARSRPASVRSASFFFPRSIRPSASSRFSISPAEARETWSIRANRQARHWGRLAWLSGIGAAGFALGLMGLVHYAVWMRRRSSRRVTTMVGPGAAAVDEFTHRTWLDDLTPGKQLALLIAVGIGVHNFGEGLAIGQAAATGAASLAVTLIVGFALHNATEGFGICGPLAGEHSRPTWGFLAAMGLIGGAPTFFGTLLGNAWTSEAMSVVFFAVAAGSILYVVQELFAVNRKYGHTVLVTWLVLAGLLLGFATDFVVSASGV